MSTGAACGLLMPLLSSGVARSLVFLLVTGASVVSAGFGLRRGRFGKVAAWRLVLIGLGLEWVGELVWSVNERVLHIDPFPSPGDAAYISGQLALLGGILLLAGLPSRSGRARGGAAYASPLAEVGVVALTAGLLSWRFVVEPTLGGSGDETLAAVISLAYPMLDVLAVAVLAKLTFEGAARDTPQVLLGAGLLCMTFADVAFAIQEAHGSYTSGGWIDSLWVMSYVLTGAACLHPRTSSPRPRPQGRVLTQRRLALVLGCGAIGPAVLLIDGPGRGAVRVTAAITLVILGLVLYRTLTLLTAFERGTRHAAHQAMHDALTGLPNRTQFVALLAAALELPGRDRLGVLRLDLDGFKTVNDTAGHAVGDTVLVEVARRICREAPPDAVVARLAADEFAVLVPGTPPRAVHELAERLVRAVRAPFGPAGDEIWLRASVGWSRPAHIGAGTDQLLGGADVALWTAKSRGGGRAVAHDPAMDAEALGRPQLAARLQHAIDRDELELHYQPVVDGFGFVLGFEALVRWRRDGQLVQPGDFLPAAHSAGLMPEIDRWVLDRALAQLARWRGEPGSGDLHIGVNLSVRTLQHPGIVDDVLALLARHEVPHDRLMLELTEEAAASGPEIRRRLASLRHHRVRIALDDFGTGYSSLAYLEGMPADVLKIAKELVDPLAHEAGERVVRALVGLAHSYGMQVIAEGVEVPAQCARLLALEVDWLQGYLFGRPVPPRQAEAFWRSAGRAGPGALTSGSVQGL